MRLLYHATGAVPAGELSEVDLVGLYRHQGPPAGGMWLRSNFVTSLDGAISGADGRTGSINTPSDHQVFALHRAHADVILVGAQTVRSERYRAVDLAAWQREIRSAEGLSESPVLAIVTRSLDLDPGLVRSESRQLGPVMIFTTSSHERSAVVPFTAAGIDVVESGRGHVDLVEVTRLLAARGHLRVLCEGGPRLHRDLLARGLLDELSLTLAPLAVGGDAGRATSGGWLSASFALHFAVHAQDETLFLNYRRSA